VGAELTGPIFTSGAISGQVRSAEAQYQQALLAYQQTILNALRETNDALAGTLNRAEEVELQLQRVEALREFVRLAQLKFEKGVAGYLEVLVAENERFAAELASIRLLAERYNQIVNVYQAMGGGWVDLADSMTQ
jgi:multidrug efflux system outer membrane protein